MSGVLESAPHLAEVCAVEIRSPLVGILREQTEFQRRGDLGGQGGERLGRAAALATNATAKLTKDALLRNLDIADKLGCLDDPGLAQMRGGKAPTVRRGPYKGDQSSVDHIIPRAVLPECFRRGLSISPEDRHLAHFHHGPVETEAAKGFLKDIGEA